MTMVWPSAEHRARQEGRVGDHAAPHLELLAKGVDADHRRIGRLARFDVVGVQRQRLLVHVGDGEIDDALREGAQRGVLVHRHRAGHDLRLHGRFATAFAAAFSARLLLDDLFAAAFLASTPTAAHSHDRSSRVRGIWREPGAAVKVVVANTPARNRAWTWSSACARRNGTARLADPEGVEPTAQGNAWVVARPTTGAEGAPINNAPCRTRIRGRQSQSAHWRKVRPPVRLWISDRGKGRQARHLAAARYASALGAGRSRMLASRRVTVLSSSKARPPASSMPP